MPTEGITTTIFRYSPAAAGIRRVMDDASRISVVAFPFSAIGEITGDKSHRRLGTPGMYILSDGDSVYIGETGNVTRRLVDHATAPSKTFATEVFVASAFSEHRFDKAGALYFQMKFHELAVAAGHMHVLGATPPTIHLSDEKRAPLDAMRETARRLLYDAGCRAFDSCTPPRHASAPAPEGDGVGEGGDGSDVGFFQIGVATAPQGAAEYELHYGNIWARGHAIGEVFVIAAGSDIRATINPSANAIFRERHKLLRERGALQSIPGVRDRLRLTQAIAVASPAVGAKVVCGAHVNSNQWRPLRPARQVAGRE